MNLGKLIKFLGKQNQNVIVEKGFDSPHSYRGYYDQLAFEPTDNILISDMLKCAKEALNSTYTGYKGGKFTMTKETECHLAYSGETGKRLKKKRLVKWIKNIIKS